MNGLSRRGFVAAAGALALAPRSFRRCEPRGAARHLADAGARMGAAAARTAARSHRGLRDLPREVLRRAQSPAVLSALGHERRPRRRHRARERLAAAACARRIGSHPRAVSRRLRRASRTIRRAAYERRAHGPPGHVRARIPAADGLAAHQRRPVGVQSHGPVDAGRRQAHRTHAPLRGVLRRQRPGRP